MTDERRPCSSTSACGRSSVSGGFTSGTFTARLSKRFTREIVCTNLTSTNLACIRLQPSTPHHSDYHSLSPFPPLSSHTSIFYEHNIEEAHLASILQAWVGLDGQNQKLPSRPLTDPTDSAMQAQDDQEAVQNKMINEEYKVWKKNSVFLYDVMYR